MKALFLFLLLYTASVFAQKREAKALSMDFIYGQKFLKTSSFNGQLNSLDQLKPGGTISYVGIGFSSGIVVSRGDFFDHFGNMYYTQIIPQSIKINDTINSKITGFNFGFTIMGFDFFPRQKIFNTYVNLGINTGRLKLFGNDLTKEKNPYFSPKLSIQPTLTLGIIRLFLRLEYDYDISKKNWRKTYYAKANTLNLNKTSNTGLNVLACVGYIFKTNNRHKKSSIGVD